MEKRKKILIVGNSAKEFALVKKFKNYTCDIFVAPGNSAIKEIDGLDYVVRNRNGYYNKMLVKVLRQNSEYCIVKQYTTEELQELGFTNTEIYNMKNINLYDEIILNPTEEQLLQ